MSSEPLRVAVLMGGTSAEHDVSVCSGLNVLDALDPARFTAVPVYLRRDGRWVFGFRPPAPDLSRPPGSVSAGGGDGSPAPPPQAGEGTFERLRSGAFDVVFIALHGAGGEDGSVQGMLELAGVAYTGSGVLASALAMDKVRSKRMLAAVGVPVARHATARAGEAPAAAAARVTEQIGVPCVIKPAVGGSSFGTTIVTRRSEVAGALQVAWAEHPLALVEEYLGGRELTCGVLGGGVEPALALPVTEIVPVGGEFFDFRAKYTAGACREITPAALEEDLAEQVRRLAVRAHEELGCEGMSRSDFIVTERGPVFLETNTIPGMTATSLLPQQAAAVGIDLCALVSRLVDSALARARCRRAGERNPA